MSGDGSVPPAEVDPDRERDRAHAEDELGDDAGPDTVDDGTDAGAAATAADDGDRPREADPDASDEDAGAAGEESAASPHRVLRTVETQHWTGIAALVMAGVGLGAIFESEALLLVAVVGVGYAAFARAGDPPEVALEVERELGTTRPDVDDDVRVTVTVTNVGGSTLPDLRLVDGVPAGLAVADGPARLGTALRPGKLATLSYTVTAVRGTHEWEPLTVIARDASGSWERTAEVPCETTMRCAPSLDASADLPLRGLTTPYQGRVATDVGGPGLEFHATRQYRHGDPLSRIDWKRYARTGELSTTQFRQERAATVVLLVDCREEAYVAPDENAANAVERATDAAGQAFSILLESGDRVGLASFGPEECWLPPATGEVHRARAKELLTGHPAFSVTPSEGPFFPSFQLRRLRRRLPGDAQLIVFSPLSDDYITSVVRRLDAYGHLVTVVSPDSTADDTPGHRLAREERRGRIRALRGAGIRVVDWGERRLAVELARSTRRWSP